MYQYINTFSIHSFVSWTITYAEYLKCTLHDIIVRKNLYIMVVINILHFSEDIVDNKHIILHADTER